MNLKYFTKDTYRMLKQDLELNKSKYYDEDDWLKQYFEEKEIYEPYKESTINVKDVNLICSGYDDDNKNKDDIANTIAIYSAYKDKITPAVASNPLMWTALCHIDYKDYILERWKKDNGNVSIQHRFFATDGRTSLLYYNAISRLWWSGYITYDENNIKDPWELTRVLFSAQMIQKDLTDQSFSMNPTIVRGLLKALKRIQKENNNLCTKVFRKCCDSYLNYYGAVTVIDALSETEIECIAYDYMKKEIAEDKSMLKKKGRKSRKNNKRKKQQPKR